MSDGFFQKLVQGCRDKLLCSPINLTSVWLYESGVSAKAHNARGGASGLCQLMPMNFHRVGWSGDDLGFIALTAEEQLPYALKYYEPYRGKLTDRVQCYVATYVPKMLGTDPSMETILTSKTDADPRPYTWNIGFDVERKGYITRGDLARAIDGAQRDNAKRWAEIVERIRLAS